MPPITRRHALSGLATGVAALALGGCLFRPVHSFRFRVTVEVDMPGACGPDRASWR